ncbi:SagB/ThcOx family dehydrogenase [Candidatus Magnetaquicoccus inordinatus]|uniref:SagB/ThcOx family dehydrogenase n=1 Tax=Candidatus Magnetaquicoccus inordinatus TaxID=2496818 RepID=UPI00102C5B81|nr:nitroreductase family protein [Candidatus Magnetaquicoccus inordinatus]
MEDDPVLAYHQASKHAPYRYAPGPGYLDWANQPDPFRRFPGTAQELLPLAHGCSDPPFVTLWQQRTLPPQPLHAGSLSYLLAYSLGLAVWKLYGQNRWALRCHPSSGNLHPIEANLLAADPFAGVLHYSARDHLLERRWQPSQPAHWRSLFPPGCFAIALSLVHQRESWKYGLRSYRYCQLNLGHAAAAVAFAAAALGWQTAIAWQLGDQKLATMAGLQEWSSVEKEHPGLLLTLSTQTHPPAFSWSALAESVAQHPFLDQPSPLAAQKLPVWPGIDAVSSACHKADGGCFAGEEKSVWPPLTPSSCTLSAATLLRGRRSGQAYDPRPVLSQASFFRILDRLLPRAGLPPWDLLPEAARVHPVLLVHRVADLPPGRYLLLRDPQQLALWQTLLPADTAWQPVAAAPAHLPLFLLKEEPCAEQAALISCQQEIAADGFFSLALLADFAQGLAKGAWGYRALHWEAGIIGQVLYLAAEEEGVRGTGIGCFFDDLFHQWLGVTDNRLQTIYHFTIGMPIADQRIQTTHPYAHLPKERLDYQPA